MGFAPDDTELGELQRAVTQLYYAVRGRPAGLLSDPSDGEPA